MLSDRILCCLVAAACLAGAAAAQPPNDECAGAIAVTNGNTPGSSVGATTSAGVPPGACVPYGADVWYSYVATCTGSAQISFCAPEGGSATFDTVVQIFSGTCGSLLRVGCNDDSCGLQSKLVFPVTSGALYYINVASFGTGGTTGSFVFNLQCLGQLPGVLTNGPGNCTARVTVDGYGAFGLFSAPATNLDFTSSAGALVTTTYQSAVLLAGGGINRFLTQATTYPTPALPVPTVFTGGGLSSTSSGNIPGTGGGVDFTLTQTLNSPRDIDCGTTLVQTYQFTNRTGAAASFCLIRAADFDVRGAGSDRTGTSVNAVGLPNNHWITHWDTVDEATGPIIAITAEGLDPAGNKAAAAGVRSGTYPMLPAVLSGGCGFLNNTIVNDANGDFICLAPEASADCVSSIGVNFPAVADGASFVFVTRTRLTTRPAAWELTAATSTRAGTLAVPTLFVNTLTGCVPVAGGPMALTISAPTGNPGSHYLLYVHVGKPLLGGPCGGPTAPDFGTWDIPGFATLGDASFNVAGFPVNGTGGGSTPGIALFSSVPGLAPLVTPIAVGPPPGSPVIPPVVLPANLSITVQGIIVDFTATPVIKVTNAVEISSAPCGCQP